MSREITHQTIDGRAVQVVTPERLREILDEDGDNYAKPEWLGDDDEWDVETK